MPSPTRFPTIAAASLALLVALAPLTPVHAFTSQEAENLGDPFRTNPSDTLGIPVVGLGLNIASGHFACFGFGCRDNFDSLQMRVPDGLQITLTEMFVPRGREPGNFTAGVPEQIFIFANDGVSVLMPVEENGIWKQGAVIGTTVFPMLPISVGTVLGPGLYDIVAANCCPPGTIVAGGSWEVQFTATIQTVPEPAALLVATGALLAGLFAGWRWRRTRLTRV